MRSRVRRPHAVAVLVAALVLGACGSEDDGAGAATNQRPAVSSPAGADTVSGEIVVFAAASLTEAFRELGEAFTELHPDASVTFSFAASSALAAQVLEGAPADVFASADLANMDHVVEGGGADSEPVNFAGNLLEIVVEAGNPLDIAGIEDLADDDLIVVTCAPEVPCGTYAERVVDNAGVTVEPDSYEENVKAVVAKVRLGEADVGIAYATDITAAGDAVDGVPIPAEINVAATYPIVTTSEATNPTGGAAFVDFVLGPTGQATLARYGFAPP